MSKRKDEKITDRTQITPQNITRGLKSICRPELNKLIELVNSIPPDQKLPHLRELTSECQKNDWDVREVAKEKLEGVPDWFHPEQGPLGRYQIFRRLRKAVHEISQLTHLNQTQRDAYRKAVMGRDGVWNNFVASIKKDLWRETSYEDFLDCDGEWEWPRLQVVLDQDPETGFITVRGDEWVGALVRIDVDRLRECPKCHLIFWANRKDKQACSDPCLSACRQQKYRQQPDRERQIQYEQHRAGRERKARLAKQQK